MCVPSPEHTLRTLSTNRRGEGEAPPPAPSTYTPLRTRPAHARLTPGPYASDGAGGGGGKERRERWRRPRLLRAWGWGPRRGGAPAHAPRPGEGRGSRWAVPARPLAPPRRAHAPPPPGGALTRQRGGWAVRGASGFLGANRPPRAPLAAASSRRVAGSPSLAAPLPAPPRAAPDTGGRTGVSLCRPGFRDVRGGRQGSCPGLLPGPHYESQRAAPPRAWAAEAVPVGSWSSQRPRAR